MHAKWKYELKQLKLFASTKSARYLPQKNTRNSAECWDDCDKIKQLRQNQR